MRSEALARAVSILRLLESGRRVTLHALADQFGVHHRTIRRDLEALEAAGVPITTAPGVTRWQSGEWWLCR